MTIFFGVTAVLLLLANILQAVAAMNAKQDIRALNLSLFRTEKERDKAERQRDQATVEAQRANQLRDRIERAGKVVAEDRDEARSTIKGQRENIEQLERIIGKLNDERQSLYYRNSKGQIAKLHP
jgi:biopolymer transport protein ExbB/TolQ